MTTTQYVPDLSILSDEELDAYLLPIVEAAREADDRALMFDAKAKTATDEAKRGFYRRGVDTHLALAEGFRCQADPLFAEWQRRGCPDRVTRTRAQFLKADPRSLVIFPEGRAPVVAPKPARMSDKAYYEHIDRAGRVVITWRLAEDDGRRFDDVARDAVSARALWCSNDRYNVNNPGSRNRRIYLTARWED